MKTNATLLAGAALLLLPMMVVAQSTIPWSTVGAGFAVASSPTSTVTSNLGDVAIGRTYGTSFNVEAGFLVDTLLRGSITAIGQSGDLPEAFGLRQNYPNPFNPMTTISYSLPHRSQITLTVFTMLGQKVAELVNGEVEAGTHEVQFNASNLASGVYCYRLRAGPFTDVKTLVLVR